MTRLASLLALALALASAGCDKPDEKSCRDAIANMRHLMGTENLSDNNKLEGEVRRRQLSGKEGLELAFRLALRSIDNFKITPMPEIVDGQTLVTLESLAPLYDVGGDAQPQLGRDIVQELGALVYARASEGVSPLS